MTGTAGTAATDTGADAGGTLTGSGAGPTLANIIFSDDPGLTPSAVATPVRAATQAPIQPLAIHLFRHVMDMPPVKE
ncbi:hypothetical protein HUS70_00290 [Pandoraea nosoerga]|uniref:hypothetical protein n=1 Tax=Pandoraea nosoerga TaxID=2508296 RepID=UPI00123FE579|nr:hypothetical protein [Pandoraea nosoerga]MBN4664451.1 hypothetical protein [Pandoraea nosoerga]MBN4674513.1 hypothetical protein [Pandoraea nosoerga]MBN4679781.1 hypothetical protein [Pandoraea nosoerga]MBN4743131.1 hypothetical protein [Pandoraea nosoerga]